MDGCGRELDPARDEVLEALFEPRVLPDRLAAVQAARDAAVDRVITLNSALTRRDAELDALRLRIEALEGRHDEERESFRRLLRILHGDLARLETRLGAIADTIIRAVRPR